MEVKYNYFGLTVFCSMHNYVVIVFLLTLLSAPAVAQDILGFFFNREGTASIVGGNLFEQIEISSFPLSKPDFDKKTNASIRSFSNNDNIYNEERNDGQTTKLQRVFHQIELQLPLLIAGIPATISTGAKSANTSGSFSLFSGQKIKYETKTNMMTIGISLPITEALQWSAAVGRNNMINEIPLDYEMSLSFQYPYAYSSITVKSFAHSQFLGVNISAIEGVLPLDALQQGAKISLWIPTRHAMLLFSYANNQLLPLPHFTREYKTHFAPNGTLREYKAAFLFTPLQNFTGILSSQSEFVNGRGVFYSHTTSYGSLNTLLLKTYSAQFGIKYVKPNVAEIIGDVTWRTLHGTVAGFAENWPFVNAAQLSFSQGYFNGEGEVNLLQLHAGGIWEMSKHITTGAGINFIHLRPQASANTWQSRFLSFGERNRKTYTFPYLKIDGMILSSGVKITYKGIEAVYSFSQIIPLRAVRAVQEQRELPQQQRNQPSVATHISGGAFHQLTAALSF